MKPIDVYPPYVPLVNAQALAFFEHIVEPHFTVLEFGSGRSTIWFASRCAELTSVENNPQWFRAVRRKLTELGLSGCDLRLIEFDDRKRGVKHKAMEYAAVVHEFADESLDLLFVDGKARPHCIRDGRSKVRCGGWLVADDIDWNPVKQALHFLDGWEAHTFRGRVDGAIDGAMRTNTTGFYRRPI